jgi:hypothetical protein
VFWGIHSRHGHFKQKKDFSAVSYGLAFRTGTPLVDRKIRNIYFFFHYLRFIAVYGVFLLIEKEHPLF